MFSPQIPVDYLELPVLEASGLASKTGVGKVFSVKS